MGSMSVPEFKTQPNVFSGGIPLLNNERAHLKTYAYEIHETMQAF